MSGADTRGFAYLLEPVRRQREWKFEAALSRVGNLHRQLCEWEAARAAVHEECAAQSLQVSRAWITRPDPTTKTRLLAYLAALHTRRADAEREIGTLTELLQQARRDCIVQQHALEVLEQHRTDTLKAYSTEQLRKSSTQADQDWAGREGHGSHGEGHA